MRNAIFAEQSRTFHAALISVSSVTAEVAVFMKRYLLLLFVAKFLHGETVVPIPESTSQRGEVSLPLSEWQSVWKAAFLPTITKPEVKPEPPPISAAVQSILYTARVDGQTLHCEATVQLRSLTEGWQKIPILGEEWTLEPARMPQGVTIIREDGHLSALLHGAGDFEMKLALSLDLTSGATFTVMPAVAQRFIVSEMPAGRVLTINDQPPSTQDHLCALPPKGGKVTLKLEEPRAPEPPPPPPQPSTWAADAQVAALFRDGEFQYSARLFLRAAKGSGLDATLQLPANAQVDDVSGDDLGSWRSQRSSDGSRRLISVRWKTADKLDRKLMLRYTIPQSPVASEWTLVAPQAEEKGHAAFAMEPQEGIEFTHPALQKVPPSRVLAWIRADVTSSEVLVVEGDATLALSAKSLPRVEAAKATIHEQRATTRLVADGSVLHELRYEFQHHGPLTWRFDLPEGATLLGCKVNDNDARPVLRGERQLEFALSAKGDGSTTSTVTLTWHLKGKAWDKLSGQLSLDLPKADLFTHELQWQVELPEGYDVAATEGLDRAVMAKASDRVVAFKKQLFTNEAPGVELYYQHIDEAQ